MQPDLLDGHALHIELDMRIRPRDAHGNKGSTDAAYETGRRIAREVRELVQRILGDEAGVELDRKITVS
ncbi:MAG: hypothetical protein ABIK08_11455 [Pseudomonadota bacterium]